MRIAWLRAVQSSSGPGVARVFHTLLGCVLLAAWLSLGQQLQLLIGSEGLLPLAPLAEQIRSEGVEWVRFPSLLVFAPGDQALDAGIAIGVVLAILAILGIATRAALLLSAPLYLAYTVACLDFTSFQWDSLLIECCVLAAWLPRRRAAPARHWLLRLLLFKLYLESGIAKAQSQLGDWFDGSAMTFYYETAPLPAWPAWYAHRLPDAWHHLESWGALGLEGLGAFLILGSRRCRLVAFTAFTGFQLINLATANYGFFVFLTLVLHVSLLDDHDVAPLGRLIPEKIRSVRLSFDNLRFDNLRLDRLSLVTRRWIESAGRLGFTLFAASWVAASLLTGCIHFSSSEALRQALLPVESHYRALRVANAYHLFGHITRKRVEAEFQTLERGIWSAHALRYKPGDPTRPPPFVAPHQPRVDFLLWFYGLSYRNGMPRYVTAILDKLCHQPTAVQALFPAPLPAAPEAVRIQFWRHRFASDEERRTTGVWWTRELEQTLRAVPCRSAD